MQEVGGDQVFSSGTARVRHRSAGVGFEDGGVTTGTRLVADVASWRGLGLVFGGAFIDLRKSESAQEIQYQKEG